MKPKERRHEAEGSLEEGCHEEAENPPGADTILIPKKVGWVFRAPEPSWVDPQDREEGSAKGRVASCIEMLEAAKKLTFSRNDGGLGSCFLLVVAHKWLETQFRKEPGPSAGKET